MSSYYGPNIATPGGTNTIGSVGLVDTTSGLNIRVDPFRSASVAVRTMLVDNQFTATLDSGAWTTGTTGSGTASSTTGALILSTGTTANSTATLTSTRRGRLLAGTVNIGSIAVVSTHPAGTTNNTQRFGCYTLSGGDGIYIQVSGTTFRVGYRINGSDTLTAFNVAAPTTLAGTWEISFAQGGFVIWQNGVLRHVSGATPIVFINPNFFISAECANSGGGTTNVSLTVLGAAIARSGEAEARPNYHRIATNGTTVVKIGPCTLYAIVVGVPGGSSNTATVYDNTAASGTVVTVLDTVGARSGTAIPYNLDLDNGLTVVLASGTAADITVIFS